MWSEVGHLGSECCVELAWVPVGVGAPPIVDAECGVGALLHLGKEHAATDGVDGACGDHEGLTLVYQAFFEQFVDCATLDSLVVLLLCEGAVHIEVDGPIGGGVDDIPHLRFTLCVAILFGKVVGGVHLHGEVFAGVDELQEHGEFESVCVVGLVAHELTHVDLQQFTEGVACQGALGHLRLGTLE